MLQDQSIHLVPYNSSWPEKFEQEKKLLEATIGPWITGGITHVGSTAIPGLAAKPIIDIMVGVEDLEKTRLCIDLLKKIAYQYFPYRTEIMHWFCKPTPEHRTHHLYFIPTSHPEYNARLAFRDYLRSHTQEREAYEALKKTLAETFKNDREAYTKAKTQFVKDIVALQKLNSSF